MKSKLQMSAIALDVCIGQCGGHQWTSLSTCIASLSVFSVTFLLFIAFQLSNGRQVSRRIIKENCGFNMADSWFCGAIFDLAQRKVLVVFFNRLDLSAQFVASYITDPSACLYLYILVQHWAMGELPIQYDPMLRIMFFDLSDPFVCLAFRYVIGMFTPSI